MVDSLPHAVARSEVVAGWDSPAEHRGCSAEVADGESELAACRSLDFVLFQS